VESALGRLAACLLIALLTSTCASAQAKAAAPAAGPAKQGLYDVDASGGDVRYVLEALARQSGVNIVIGPDVAGTITAHLKQMPLDGLLDNLAAVHGFDWAKKDATYVVSAKDKTAKPEIVAPPPMPEQESLIWRCRHIKANDLVTLLTGMYPGCKIAVGPSSVSPILQAPMSGAGAATGGGATSSSGSSSSTKSDDDTASTVVLYGEAKDIAKAKALLEKLDIARPQIAIEVAITEIGSNLSKELGVNWSWNDITLAENATSGIRFGSFIKQPMTFTGTLAALTTSGNAHLLAQPNISVIDGGYADILIGDRILFPKLVGYTQFGTPIYDKDEERVGIYLQIAPRVTEDDEIVLTLYPQVSLVTSYLKTQAGNYPQISTREARTTVSVKSGSTLAIGGLIKDEEIKSAEKIPLLGDLPIIGQFFRHNKNSKSRTEIVIFLTPKIVQPGK
jgi:type II secretory pathway component GspD/PulD (secretin)